MRWGLIASPNDKRTHGFCAALETAGQQKPCICSWAETANDPMKVAQTLNHCDFLRMESPGNDTNSWSAILSVIGKSQDPQSWHPGKDRFISLKLIVDSILKFIPNSCRWMNHPNDLITMTDKLVCRNLFDMANIPQAPAILSPNDSSTLRQMLIEKRWNSVFIKPRWGSSGAGIIAFRWREKNNIREEIAITTLSGNPNSPYLTKQQNRITDRDQISSFLDLILSDGAIVEKWIPKICYKSGPCDVRIVIIDGMPCHKIVRMGSGPITNLHLNAQRVLVEDLFSGSHSQQIANLHRLSCQAASLFPDSLYAGVDLIIDQSWKIMIGEINGWGDLLPGIEYLGKDTFSQEIAMFLKRNIDP